MPRTVKLDLRGAPPVSGGMRDKIPPGHYRLSVVKIEETTSRSNKKMWSANYRVSAGEQAGASLGDNFVLEDNSGGPSRIGLGRVHHLLVCLGFPVKEAAYNFDLDMCNGREFEVDVLDGEFTSSDGRKVPTSEIKRYFPVNKNGQSAPAVTAEAVAEQADVKAEAEESTPEPSEPTEEETEELSLGVDELFR